MRGWLETAIRLWPQGRASDSLMPPPEKPRKSLSHQARSPCSGQSTASVPSSTPSPPPLLASASLPPARLPPTARGTFLKHHVQRAHCPRRRLRSSACKAKPVVVWLLLFSGATSHTLLSLLQTFARAPPSSWHPALASTSPTSQLRLASSLKPSLNGKP